MGKEEGTGDCRKHDKSVIFIALEEEEEEWAEWWVGGRRGGGGLGAHRTEEVRGSEQKAEERQVWDFKVPSPYKQLVFNAQSNYNGYVRADNRQTDRQTKKDRQADKQTKKDRQTNRQKRRETETDRQTDRQTETETDPRTTKKN